MAWARGGFGCSRCVWSIRAALIDIDGVLTVSWKLNRIPPESLAQFDRAGDLPERCGCVCGAAAAAMALVLVCRGLQFRHLRLARRRWQAGQVRHRDGSRDQREPAGLYLAVWVGHQLLRA